MKPFFSDKTITTVEITIESNKNVIANNFKLSEEFVNLFEKAVQWSK